MVLICPSAFQKRQNTAYMQVCVDSKSDLKILLRCLFAPFDEPQRSFYAYLLKTQ